MLKVLLLSREGRRDSPYLSPMSSRALCFHTLESLSLYLARWRCGDTVAIAETVEASITMTTGDVQPWNSYHRRVTKRIVEL
jgi:hypothetical protein